MHKDPDGIFVRTDIWREGEWLDLWSVVHFLSGMSVAFALYLLHFDTRATVVIAFISFTAYEMWEALVHIEETFPNRCMDVVVGMISFLPTYFFLIPHLTHIGFPPVFGGVLMMNIAISALGWRASKKAATLEQTVRAKYALEREKLVKKGRGLRKKVTKKVRVQKSNSLDSI